VVLKLLPDLFSGERSRSSGCDLTPRRTRSITASLAQRDLSIFFENLADTNQLIYTTHSPFLVDADMLDRVRKVYVAQDGSTKASPDLRRGSEDPRKAGATYAIYSALNMNVAESILYGCQPIIVEGPSDQHYLTTMKTLLIAKGEIAPKREIVFPPCHGANNAKVIASILSSTDGKLPAVLLDSDDAGNKMARDLQNGLYKAEKGRVFLTDKYAAFAGSEIEDLFSFHFMVDVVDRWERKTDVPFGDVAKEDCRSFLKSRHGLNRSLFNWTMAGRLICRERRRNGH
jgi:predicted ATP-dependent endonuclease of OLD family